MKKMIALLFLAGFCSAIKAQTPVTVQSPDKQITVTLLRNADGYLEYNLQYKGQSVLNPSRLGFELSDPALVLDKWTITGSETASKNETWKQVWGEEAEVRNQYNEAIVHCESETKPAIRVDWHLRVFNDGIGFRYEFPVQKGLTYFVVKKELTSFALTGDHQTFWIPGDYDSNEYPYTHSKLSEVDATKLWMVSAGGREFNLPDPAAVQTPLMMKTAGGLYINIHEAALVDYPAMQLHVDKSSFNLSANLVPDARGNKAFLRTPAHTPWRTVLVSDLATDILASRTILNLNEPNKLKNTSWIKPMKFIGIWWLMQTGEGSWNYTDYPDSTDKNGKLIPNGHHAASTQQVKRYIDFASAHHIQGLLVEGWNTGWEAWYGNWYGRHFDYVTPYPDFDVRGIQQYAKSKGVKMIMHNETSADAAGYDQQLDTAFKFMNQFGYPAVKTGYVGQIIPRGEHHDGQWMINHYLRTIKKAADHQVMIDIHEPVRPTGLHRTYPNFLACEAARGTEFNAFAEGSPPDHETILPFTRLMGGPMDYTPGIFKLRGYAKADPNRQMHSTLAKQLALYVTMYSPVVMAADMPENYLPHLDAFKFIEDVPVDWEATKILEAEPGDYVTVVRKEKNKDNWYLGAVTDENSRMVYVPLSFLKPGQKYTAVVYRDADNADWKTNPEAYVIEKKEVDSMTRLSVKLAPGGGCAVQILKK